MPKKGKNNNNEDSATTQRRRWTEEENKEILRYLLGVIQAGKSLEKPNAVTFYEKCLNALKFEDCSVNQLKNQVKNLRSKYTKTIEWRNNTGQGVLVENGEQSLKCMALNN